MGAQREGQASEQVHLVLPTLGMGQRQATAGR